MIILKLKLDNIYGFKDFELDLTYPKKIVNSIIENEHLAGFPNFRYKKVVILMGANASGKTTLGKAIKDISEFIIKNGGSVKKTEVMTVDENGRVYFKSKNEKYKILSFSGKGESV